MKYCKLHSNLGAMNPKSSWQLTSNLGAKNSKVQSAALITLLGDTEMPASYSRCANISFLDVLLKSDIQLWIFSSFASALDDSFGSYTGTLRPTLQSFISLVCKSTWTLIETQLKPRTFTSRSFQGSLKYIIFKWRALFPLWRSNFVRRGV
jgi:hypothetical protein